MDVIFESQPSRRDCSGQLLGNIFLSKESQFLSKIHRLALRIE
jgi:hypothetical protein